MCAGHVTQRVLALNEDEARKQKALSHLPWRPTNQTISIPLRPPKPKVNEQQVKARRDELAASAHVRYEDWRSKQPPKSARDPASASVYFPKFRDRQKHKELHGEWASADQVLGERDRIDRAVSTASASFLQSPPYPKSGGSQKNMEFSYMSSG